MVLGKKRAMFNSFPHNRGIFAGCGNPNGLCGVIMSMPTLPADEARESAKTVRKRSVRRTSRSAVLRPFLALILVLTLTGPGWADGNNIPATEKGDRQRLDQRIQAAEKALKSKPESRDRQLALAKLLYFQGVAGEGKAAQRSEAMFSKLQHAEPENAVVQVYLGSLQLLRGARTLAVWDKLPLINRGLEQMDQAVERAPEQLEVRFIRAVSTHHLPFFFDRSKQSAEDFAFIAPRAAEAVRSGNLEDTLATASLYHHGVNQLEAEEKAAAIEAWTTAVEIGPQTPAGRDAAKRLKKLSKSGK